MILLGGGRGVRARDIEVAQFRWAAAYQQESACAATRRAKTMKTPACRATTGVRSGHFGPPGEYFRKRNEMPVKSYMASEYLNTQEDIVAYLNAAVDEMGDDPRLLMKAFRNVAEARGGVSELARQAKMDRVALSRALSGQRIP